jgi:hypothetical protein
MPGRTCGYSCSTFYISLLSTAAYMAQCPLHDETLSMSVERLAGHGVHSWYACQYCHLPLYDDAPAKTAGAQYSRNSAQHQLQCDTVVWM